MAKQNLNVSGIYCIKNVLTGRSYVGSSSKISNRKKSHLHLLRNGKHHSPVLQRSWDRDGEENFQFYVVEIVQDVSNILEREQYWIDKLGAYHPDTGFNVSPVAGARRGVPHSQETRDKIGLSNSGKPKSAECRAKMSAAAKGRPKSEETKQKIREAAIRQFQNEDARKKAAEYAKMASPAWLGKKLPDELKRKQSETKKAKFLNDPHARMRNAMNFPPEYRRKFSDEQVKEIRARCARGERQKDVATDYGVCQPVISHIVTRKTYYDVD